MIEKDRDRESESENVRELNRFQFGDEFFIV